MRSTPHCHYRFDATGAHHRAERRTRRVLLLTAVMMVVEIAAGATFGSMALLADGWHMATHVAALGIAGFAYRYARKHADDPRYTFGTGKFGVLGGFASGVALTVIAGLMVLESAGRLWRPAAIRFDAAMAVAVLGLAVNLLSAWWLRDEEHEHGRTHAHDHNLRAAYLHVLADALTSLLAIVALACGKLLGWIWMDPIMGIVGAAIIARWCYGLLRETAAILLDSTSDADTLNAIRAALERDASSRVADLHLWHIAPHRLAAIVSIDTDMPRSPAYYQAILDEVAALAHVTVEINVRRSA
ncbi:MAG: CDF family Co(II)/Ni(II) efflux transporter DmeF [Chromatiales bacterium]